MNELISKFIDYTKRVMNSEDIPPIDYDMYKMIKDGNRIENMSYYAINEVCDFFECNNVKRVTYLFSILLFIARDSNCFMKSARYAFEHRNELDIYEQYFLYSQIRGRAFSDGYIIPEYYEEWIRDISVWYVEYFKDMLAHIDYNNRNKDLILVLTSQFLGKGHSHSDVVLNVCKGLIMAGKKVLLLNLADLLSHTGKFDFWSIDASYRKELSSVLVLEFERIYIPFVQCDLGMPSVNMIEALISEIGNMKPGIIISVGEDIFSNIIDEVIPVCSIPLGNDLCHNYTKYLVHYNDLKSEEKNWIKKNGYSDLNTIQMNLPFKIIESYGVSRNDLGIPTDFFCIMIIGNRLENDLTEEFLQGLENLLSECEKICILIVGKLECERVFGRYKCILERYIHIEHTNELFAVCKVIDLYVNPPRFGGGTSALYAMSAQKPVVTLDYGDVYNNCGSEFGVGDISEMIQKIKLYIRDGEFYIKMASLAADRAERYICSNHDNISNLVSILEEREKCADL